MSEWEIVRFGDLYETPSRNGITRPRATRGSGYKMINMGELFAYPRISDPPMELVELNDKEKNTSTVLKGDLLFACQSLVLEGAGKCSIVIKISSLTTFESHLIRVRLSKSLCNSTYYFYFFKSRLGLNSVQTIVNQVSAAGIRGSDLEKLKLIKPSLSIQNKIVAVLSAYDDLIENNERRIAILEKMAEQIYREWFVRLRFPKHEQATFHKGIPEGWEVKNFSEELDFKTGKLNSNAAVPDGKYPFFTCSNETFKTNTFSFDLEGVLLAGNNAAGVYLSRDNLPAIPPRFHLALNSHRFAAPITANLERQLRRREYWGY